MADLLKIYRNLFLISDENDFRSYDVYDGSTFKFAGLEKFRTPRLLSTYFNKFSPYNFRNWLNIEKRWYPHSVACVVNAYYNYPDSSIDEQKIEELVEWLIGKSLIQKYSYHCWNGVDIPITMRRGNIYPNVAGLIGTSAVAQALLAVYQQKKGARIKEILLSVRNHILKNHFTVYEGIPFLRYKPITPKWQFTVNAAAKGASLIFEINNMFDEKKGLEEAERTVQSIMEAQEIDGRWKYTLDLRNSNHKEQIDFHQAYIVQSLLEIKATTLSTLDLDRTIHSAIKYQNEHQLMANGQIYYRYPNKYPANIHNQLYAYFINMMATRFGDEDYDIYAERIMNWTLDNLYDEKKGFIYGLYPLKKIDISYARWCNAHALLIISNVLKN